MKMKKHILLLIIVTLSVNHARAQFICNITPKVKEVGVAFNEKSHIKDASIIGDYREDGSGLVFLPDHIGAVFIHNIQVSELLWALGEADGNLTLVVLIPKIEFGEVTGLESQKVYLVDIKSDADIELLDIETFQTFRHKGSKLIPGKKYFTIRNIEGK